MPIIIALLAIAAVFGLGRCSVDEQPRGREIIHVQDDPITVTKRVPTPLAPSCLAAVDTLAALQQATEDLDVYAGRLGDIGDSIGTVIEQPNAQALLNDRVQEARDLQSKTARIGMAALEAQTKYDAQLALCKADTAGK